MSKPNDGHVSPTLEHLFRVAIWMQAYQKRTGELPHWTRLRDRYSCHRATAFRWLAAYKAASGYANAEITGDDDP